MNAKTKPDTWNTYTCRGCGLQIIIVNVKPNVHNGWAKRGGYWYCRDCKNTPAVVTTRFEMVAPGICKIHEPGRVTTVENGQFTVEFLATGPASCGDLPPTFAARDAAEAM